MPHVRPKNRKGRAKKLNEGERLAEVSRGGIKRIRVEN